MAEYLLIGSNISVLCIGATLLNAYDFSALSKCCARPNDNIFADNKKMTSRWIVALCKIDKKPEWISFLNNMLMPCEIKERDSRNLIGTKTEKRLIDQGALIEIYATLAQVENLK
jgi:hypothetical protein